MKRFTDERDAETPDEVWFVEPPPIFTLGLNAERAHLLTPGQIPVLQIDRGGQVTYHGPGQLVVYLLLDLKRLRIGLRGLGASGRTGCTVSSAGLTGGGVTARGFGLAATLGSERGTPGSSGSSSSRQKQNSH